MHSKSASMVWMWGSFAMWAAFIFYLSSKPIKSYPHIDIPYIDKIIHLVLYTILGWLSIRAFWHSFPHPTPDRRILLITISGLICVCYGILDEIHQEFFVFTRGYQISDIIMDGVGTVVGINLYKFLIEKARIADLNTDTIIEIKDTK